MPEAEGSASLYGEILMSYYVYILASVSNVTVYIGVTNDLIRRVYEHKTHADPDSFTSQYKVHKLVYFERISDIRSALEREKQLKGWRRSKKNMLIEKLNPEWKDLYPIILGAETDSSAPFGRSE